MKLNGVYVMPREDTLLLYHLSEFEICTARQSPDINKCNSVKISEFAVV